MITARAVALTAFPWTAGKNAVAVIAPQPGSGHAAALALRETDAVAVTLTSGAGPATPAAAVAGDGYLSVIEHTGDLRRTVKRLRAAGAEDVMAASPAGVELAERIAWQLGRPGSGLPGSAPLRTDLGAQLQTLSHTGIAVPRTLRTASLNRALAWTRESQAHAYWLTPALIGAPAEYVECPTPLALAAAWPKAQKTAFRRTGNAALVLQEQVEGRQYVVISATHPRPYGPQHTVTAIWAHQHAPTGLLDRIDLLHRRDLLARRLTLYVHRVLDGLGVRSGSVACHIAFEPEHGPILLSASVITHRSSCDEAIWKITGHDPIDTALGTALYARRRSSAGLDRRITLIRLGVPATGASRLVRPQEFAQLPTAVRADSKPVSFIPRIVPTAPWGETCEIILCHENPQAIETDYRRILALTADLHKIRQE
ncbi:MAG TPA: hypothetical protein VIU15_23775 [Streptomyces sp.]